MKNGFTLSEILPVEAEAENDGTKVTLIHSDMPDEQVDSYRQDGMITTLNR